MWIQNDFHFSETFFMESHAWRAWVQNPLPLSRWLQSSLPHFILLWGEFLFSLLSSLSTFHVFCKPHEDPVKLKKGPPCKEETVHLNLSCFVVNLRHSHYTTWAVLKPLIITWTCSTNLSAIVTSLALLNILHANCNRPMNCSYR